MENFIIWCQGKKAYFFAVCMALYALASAFNWLTPSPEQNAAVYGLLAALFGIAIKAGVNRELGKMKVR